MKKRNMDATGKIVSRKKDTTMRYRKPDDRVSAEKDTRSATACGRTNARRMKGSEDDEREGCKLNTMEAGKSPREVPRGRVRPTQGHPKLILEKKAEQMTDHDA